MHLNLSSAIYFDLDQSNLDQSKIWSSGNGLERWIA